MHWAMASAWITSCRGPTSQPARQPGMACDLERLLMVTTCSGNSAARLGTRPPGASPAYTSSATTHSEWRRAKSPSAARSRVAQDHAAGIVGRGEENRPRARGDCGRERRQIDAKTPRRRRRHPHHARAGNLQRGGIARIQGFERDHFIAGTRDTQRGDEQGVLRAGEKNDIVGGHRLAVASAVCRRNRLAQMLPARRRRVVGVAGAQSVRWRAPIPAPGCRDQDRRRSAK